MGPSTRNLADRSVDRSRLSRGLTAVALVCALAIAAEEFATNLTFYHDDAYITLRYARNLLEHHAAEWNLGERVQGYTSTLHLGLLWVFGRMGVDLWVASRIIGIASFAILAAGVFWLQRRLSRADPADPFWVLPVVLTLTACPLIVWSLSGLETLLFSLLAALGCLLFLWAIERPGDLAALAASGGFLGLACFARPDGAVFAAVCMAWLVARRRPGRWRDAAVFAAAGLIVIVPSVAWQWLYYGSFIPNSFYAKVGVPLSIRMEAGLRYLAGYAIHPPCPLLLLLILLAAMLLRSVWAKRLGYLLSIIGTYLVYVVVVAGGDHMPAYRFMAPITVPLAYALYLAVRALLPRPDRAAVLGVLGVAMVLPALQLVSPPLNPQIDPAAVVGAAVGKHIQRAWPAGALVALNTAGSTPYYAKDLRFIDMLGLNDAHIARQKVREILLEKQNWPGHAKGDGRYVLSRQPDYIIMGAAEGTAAWQPVFLSDLQIAQDPRLAAHYEGVEVWIDAEGWPTDREKAMTVFAYYRKVRPAASQQTASAEPAPSGKGETPAVTP